MRTLNEIVKQMVSIEMDPNSHISQKEDFENEIDFYLESVGNESYESYLKESLAQDEIEAYGLVNVWNLIRDNIAGK